jgi:hypothetical protein
MVTNRCRDRNSALPNEAPQHAPKSTKFIFRFGKEGSKFFWILFLVWKGRTAKEVTVN